MKRLVLGFVLTLAALGLMTSPAMAEPGPSPSAPMLSAADQEFLTTLASPAPTLAAKRPIVGKATCMALCDSDPSVSCTGTTCSAVDRNCSTGTRGNVICDGVKTKCPTPCPPPPPPSCDDLAALCASTCGLCPIQSFNCDPYSCHCWLSPACL
jgi:hypothetical protein